MSFTWLVVAVALSVAAPPASEKHADDSTVQDKAAPEQPAPEAKPAPPEQLPAPRPVEPAIVLYSLPSLPPQLGTREVWQYYGVDRSGRFLPRVILSPHGAYYLYNGRPYPWTTTRPGLYMPYALD